MQSYLLTAYTFSVTRLVNCSLFEGNPLFSYLYPLSRLGRMQFVLYFEIIDWKFQFLACKIWLTDINFFLCISSFFIKKGVNLRESENHKRCAFKVGYMGSVVIKQNTTFDGYKSNYNTSASNSLIDTKKAI